MRSLFGLFRQRPNGLHRANLHAVKILPFQTPKQDGVVDGVSVHTRVV